MGASHRRDRCAIALSGDEHQITRTPPPTIMVIGNIRAAGLGPKWPRVKLCDLRQFLNLSDLNHMGRNSINILGGGGGRQK